MCPKCGKNLLHLAKIALEIIQERPNPEAEKLTRMVPRWKQIVAGKRFVFWLAQQNKFIRAAAAANGASIVNAADAAWVLRRYLKATRRR